MAESSVIFSNQLALTRFFCDFEIPGKTALGGVMEDDHLKSKNELLNELAAARKRISELEGASVPDFTHVPGSELFDNHPGVALFIDAENGHVLWANHAACSFYGYSRQEFISLHISDINIMSREESRIPIRQVHEGVRNRFLFTHLKKNGDLCHVEVYAVPMQYDGRQIICSFVRDVAGLPQEEVSIERNAVLQDSILSAMGIVPFYCLQQDDYPPIYIGPSIDAVTGFASQLFYKDPQFWKSRIHPDDRERVAGRFSRLEFTKSTRCEYRWQVADGSYRWFSLSMRLTACGESDEGELCVAGMFWDITERKRTEFALLEREERYRTIADFTYNWEFWIGPEGDFLYVSPSFERVTGYQPQDLKKDPNVLFESIIHPQDREWVRSSIMDGLLSDATLTFDFRIVTRSGDVRWIGHASQPVYDDKGDPLGRRVSNRDITEFKEIVQALRDKNQFIDSILDNSPASVYAKDVDGRYLFGNARFMEYAGKPPHEVMGKTDFGLFPNEVAEQFREGDQRVLGSGEPYFEELDVNFHGQQEYWTSTKFPLLNAEGQILGVCGISLDITDLREAEASLRRLTRAVEQSPVSIAMLDTQGHIIFANPYFSKTSGYMEEDILGRELGFMLDEENSAFYEHIWEQLRMGEDWHGEVRNLTRSGDVLWESTSISPVRNVHDVISHFVVVKDDITERKRLQRLERDVERIVRHDLKSPIMSFIWVPRTLRKQDNITDEQAMLLDDLEQSAHRLLKMVNLSLDIFKMEEGTYQFTPEDLNIVRVIHNVLRDQQRTLASMKVSVDVTLSGSPASENDCLLVRGEELLCHSMLSNLIKNAVEASEPGGRVSVDCASGKKASVTIHNNGVVPKEIRDSFFDKYSTFGKKFGTGLGTYSARLIAETQGGTIEMRCESRQGTDVVVTFLTA